MSLVKLPAWALDALDESCSASSWSIMIDEVYARLKVSKNMSGKRISQFSELEQAALIEQELKRVRSIMLKYYKL